MRVEHAPGTLRLLNGVDLQHNARHFLNGRAGRLGIEQSFTYLGSGARHHAASE